MTDNPFRAPSVLPYGLPPFDRITEADFRPAFERGMAEHLLEVDAIARDSAPASFDNTVEALEASGQLLARVAAVFFNLTSSHTTETLSALEEEIAPQLAAHSDAIQLDARLFARLQAIAAQGPGGPVLNAEQSRLLEQYLSDFRRAGANLGPAEQTRLKAINQELSQLSAGFQNRLLAESNELALHLTDVEELSGLSPDAVAAAAAAASERGLDGGYLITLVLPTGQPALASLERREVRRRLFEAAHGRGLRGNDHDTRQTLTRIVALRAERAGLLGHPHHASYAVEDQTAKTPEAVTEMLGRLAGPAARNARIEADDLAAALSADGQPAPLQPWDWAYYAERVRRERYSIDDAALRPYFELGQLVRQGVFHAASALYGISFERRHDLPTYHDDVEVYEVKDADGEGLGLILADWFARDSKRGGAWMSSYLDQSALLGHRPVITLNLNIPKPAPGEPALLSSDEVDTAFHEFGHVLHGLFSDVTYPRFSGTNVPRDFVEFPSQVNEMWAWEPSVLSNYAAHHATGERLPQELAERLLETRSYGQGFATTEYLAATVLDWEWHQRGPSDPPIDPAEVEGFERQVLARWGLEIVLDGVCLVPPRYRSSYFAHIFSGGYSAGYYSYIWSEVLDADLVDWFTERGGLNRGSGEHFRRSLLARGGAVDPLEAFAAVRGRAPEVTPLLRRRKLLAPPNG